MFQEKHPDEISVKKKNTLELFFADIGNATSFVLKVFKNTFGKDFEFSQFLKQCFVYCNRFKSLLRYLAILQLSFNSNKFKALFLRR